MQMINRVVLVGRLTKDPELRYTQSGVAVATIRLAVNRRFTNQQGEREADFINVTVWRRQAENVANYLQKGSLTGVDGRIQTRNYENNEGRRVFVTDVVAESVQFLEPKGTGASSPSQGMGQEPGGGDASRDSSQFSDDPFAGDGKPIDISDDDLPF